MSIMMFKVNGKIYSRSVAKTTLERNDDDPQGVLSNSNKLKVLKSGGVSFIYKIGLFFIAWMLVSTSQVFAASSYPVLESLVKQQKYQQAYQQATKLRAQNEGDPRFDYLYGFSALQSGHYSEAVFALDRVTVATPNVIRPRLELARAYLKLNNKNAALKEFNDVLNLSPPPQVRQNVQSFISTLNNNQLISVKQSVIKKLATFALGYDDNINFGYQDDTIDLIGFGTITLDPNAVKQKSGFAESSFQIKQDKNIDKIRSTFALANIKHRDYFKNGDYNVTDLDLRKGFVWNQKNKQYQLNLRARPVMLGGKFYSNTLSVDAITRKGLGKGMIGSLSLSLENYDQKRIDLADRKRALIVGRLDAQKGNSSHMLSAHLGKEWPDDQAGAIYSRDIAGLSYSLTQNWNAKNKSFLNLDYRHFDYQGRYAISPFDRDDDRFIVKVAHEIDVHKNTAIIFAMRHISNQSSLELYDAERNEISVGVRYGWD